MSSKIDENEIQDGPSIIDAVMNLELDDSQEHIDKVMTDYRRYARQQLRNQKIEHSAGFKRLCYQKLGVWSVGFII